MIILALFEKTGTCRVFNSFNVAEEQYGVSSLYSRPSQIDERITNLESASAAVYWWLKDRGEPIKAPPKTTDRVVLAEWIFENGVAHGNKVFSTPASKAKAGFRVDLEAAKRNLENKEVPKQVTQICSFFVEQKFDFYTKKELRQMCLTYSYMKHVKTKQDPWRIFRYYSPTLKELGVIT
jgi:hypothetical protein